MQRDWLKDSRCIITMQRAKWSPLGPSIPLPSTFFLKTVGSHSAISISKGGNWWYHGNLCVSHPGVWQWESESDEQVWRLTVNPNLDVVVIVHFHEPATSTSFQVVSEGQHSQNGICDLECLFLRIKISTLTVCVQNVSPSWWHCCERWQNLQKAALLEGKSGTLHYVRPWHL